jgi:hypothetical protein
MMRAFAAVKRGRPKNAAANDNDKLDPGTAELQMKRAQLARGLDPTACAHPLDLLRAKGWLTDVEQRAGFRYAALYRRVIGRTDMSYGRFYDGLSGIGGRSPMMANDEADQLRAEAQFRRAKRDLLRAGLQVALVTERVSVFGIWPGWIFAAAGERDHDCQRLRAGLAVLGDSFAARA